MYEDNLSWQFSDGGGILTVDVVGSIGVDFEGSEFIKLMTSRMNSGVNEVILNIYSVGGYAYDAIAVYDFIRTTCRQDYPEAKFVSRIFGYAASAATIISCAMDRVEMSPNSLYGIHYAYMLGKPEEDKSKMLDSANSSIVRIYMQRTGMNERQVRKLLDAAEKSDEGLLWMTAAEAKKKKFIDVVMKETVRAELPNMLLPAASYDPFKNVNNKVKHTDMSLVDKFLEAIAGAKIKMKEQDAQNLATALASVLEVEEKEDTQINDKLDALRAEMNKKIDETYSKKLEGEDQKFDVLNEFKILKDAHAKEVDTLKAELKKADERHEAVQAKLKDSNAQFTKLVDIVNKLNDKVSEQLDTSKKAAKAAAQSTLDALMNKVEQENVSAIAQGLQEKNKDSEGSQTVKVGGYEITLGL